MHSPGSAWPAPVVPPRPPHQLNTPPAGAGAPTAATGGLQAPGATSLRLAAPAAVAAAYMSSSSMAALCSAQTMARLAVGRGTLSQLLCLESALQGELR